MYVFQSILKGTVAPDFVGPFNLYVAPSSFGSIWKFWIIYYQNISNIIEAPFLYVAMGVKMGVSHESLTFRLAFGGHDTHGDVQKIEPLES